MAPPRSQPTPDTKADSGTGTDSGPGTDSETGSASIWLVALLMLAGCALLAVLGLGAAVAARHRAEAAADLAALAAADRMLADPAGACDEAARVAAAQQARLTSCVLRSDAALDAVEVSVESPVSGRLFAALPPAHGRARAGPQSTTGLPATTGQPSATGLPAATGPLAASGYDGAAPASSSVSSLIEPALSSGSLPLPHLGDWIQDGQPRSHSQAVIASRVALSQARARW